MYFSSFNINYLQPHYRFELRPFDIMEIPTAFREERDLFDLYRFISENKTVTFEDVHCQFEDVSNEKLELFIGLLCRKNFVGLKNGKLTVVKQFKSLLINYFLIFLLTK